MAEPILMHPFLYYFLIGFPMLLMCICAWIGYKYIITFFTDVIIFLDKSNRWDMIRESVAGRTKITYQNKVYFLKEKSGILNKRGKALYIFSENKPEPMSIEYSQAKWLTSESLMATINNELIKMMVQPTNKARDFFILLGAIGGLVAGMSSVLILLKTYGVI